MSRRDPDLADQVGCLVLGLMWAAIAAVFALLIKSSQVSPEDQLLRLQPSYAWLRRIEPIDCPECGTLNESHVSRCYRCSAFLTPTVTVEPTMVESTEIIPSAGKSTEDKVIIGVLLFLIVFATVLLIMANVGV